MLEVTSKGNLGGCLLPSAVKAGSTFRTQGWTYGNVTPYTPWRFQGWSVAMSLLTHLEDFKVEHWQHHSLLALKISRLNIGNVTPYTPWRFQGWSVAMSLLIHLEDFKVEYWQCHSLLTLKISRLISGNVTPYSPWRFQGWTLATSLLTRLE